MLPYFPETIDIFNQYKQTYIQIIYMTSYLLLLWITFRTTLYLKQNVSTFSYSSCSLVKYMDRHKIKPDTRAFNLVNVNTSIYYCYLCLDVFFLRMINRSKENMVKETIKFKKVNNRLQQNNIILFCKESWISNPFH